jgi:hypothetical protein
MALIQTLVKTFLPKGVSNSIQAESESWLLTCSHCGTVRSVWDVGGVRFGAASVGKKTMVWCATCRQLRMMSMERKAAPGE